MYAMVVNTEDFMKKNVITIYARELFAFPFKHRWFEKWKNSVLLNCNARAII